MARARQRIGRKEWLVLKFKDEIRRGYGYWKRRSRVGIRCEIEMNMYGQ